MCDKLGNTKCYDSRAIRDGTLIRRYRKCKKCGQRIVSLEFMVPKRSDGKPTDEEMDTFRQQALSVIEQALSEL